MQVEHILGVDYLLPDLLMNGRMLLDSNYFHPRYKPPTHLS